MQIYYNQIYPFSPEFPSSSILGSDKVDSSNSMAKMVPTIVKKLVHQKLIGSANFEFHTKNDKYTS